MAKLNKQQIGRCGELLVQYLLLKQGIESAPLTTDFGIDLVAFRADNKNPVSIQVKTCTYQSDSDKWVEFWVANDCPAKHIALVDLERDKCWLFSFKEFTDIATKSGEGSRLWWWLPGYGSKRSKSKHKEENFTHFEMNNLIPKVFGLP